MIRPERWRFISGATWRMVLNTPLTFVSMMASSIASVTSSTGLVRQVAALLQRMSMAPNCSMARFTARSHLLGRADVCLDRERRGTELVDGRHRRIQLVSSPQAHRCPGMSAQISSATILAPSRARCTRVRGALAARGPGDECDFVLELHDLLSGRPRRGPGRDSMTPCRPDIARAAASSDKGRRLSCVCSQPRRSAPITVVRTASRSCSAGRPTSSPPFTHAASACGLALACDAPASVGKWTQRPGSDVSRPPRAMTTRAAARRTSRRARGRRPRTLAWSARHRAPGRCWARAAPRSGG